MYPNHNSSGDDIPPLNFHHISPKLIMFTLSFSIIIIIMFTLSNNSSIYIKNFLVFPTNASYIPRICLNQLSWCSYLVSKQIIIVIFCYLNSSNANISSKPKFWTAEKMETYSLLGRILCLSMGIFLVLTSAFAKREGNDTSLFPSSNKKQTRW